MADRVELRGAVRRAELPALIRSSDVVVCLPWYEPFGIVPLEAMACGVPVVGTAVGGLLDTVVSGVTGRLVPPRRPDLAAEAVNELLADDSLRAEAGAAGVARMRARYTWNAVAAETELAYRRACRHAGVHRWRDGGTSSRRAVATAGVRGDHRAGGDGMTLPHVHDRAFARRARWPTRWPASTRTSRRSRPGARNWPSGCSPAPAFSPLATAAAPPRPNI